MYGFNQLNSTRKLVPKVLNKHDGRESENLGWGNFRYLIGAV